VLIGTLREEGILNNTIICFSSDHGDMLGNHSMWAKRVLYQPAVNVPMIVVGPTGDPRVPDGTTDERIVGWQDIRLCLIFAALISPSRSKAFR
jgi:arylsulfatase A-like enzyme